MHCIYNRNSFQQETVLPGKYRPVTFTISTLLFSSFIEKLELLLAGGKSSNPNRLKILLADDDEDDRDMFEEAIQRINPLIRVDALQNGISLITELEKGIFPDMIFLDLNMPGKNGKECLAEIRNNRVWSKIPIVIYSTSANKRDINETYSGGASLYLLKPNSFQDLIKIIKHVFTIDLEKEKVPQEKYLLTQAV